jgi:hypothetical protein
MKDLVITNNNNLYLVPQINFNATTGHCEIVGESYLETTKEFYGDIMDWLRNYMYEVRGSLYIEIKLNYFNTSSSRCLLEMFRLLKGYQLQGNQVEIVWYVSIEEDFMVEEVEDFITNSGLMIKQILY